MKALIVFPLTIAKKISLSVILILVVSVSGLAWLSARSLQSGFNDYLKEKQEQEKIRQEKIKAIPALEKKVQDFKQFQKQQRLQNEKRLSQN